MSAKTENNQINENTQLLINTQKELLKEKQNRVKFLKARALENSSKEIEKEIEYTISTCENITTTLKIIEILKDEIESK